MFVEAGLIVLAAFISPFKEDRNKVRSLIGNCDFIEIYCRSHLEVCEARDVKGLYKKARAGLIKNFIGVSSPYEVPDAPEIVIDTANVFLDEGVSLIQGYLNQQLTLGAFEPNSL